MSTHYNALQRETTGKLCSVVSAGRRSSRRKLGALPVVVVALLVSQSALPVVVRWCWSSPVVVSAETSTTGDDATTTGDDDRNGRGSGEAQCYAAHLLYAEGLYDGSGELELAP